MTAQPQRRAQRRDHLDASAIPVELALLALADQNAETAAAPSEVHEIVAQAIADHCRKFAEELHWVP